MSTRPDRVPLRRGRPWWLRYPERWEQEQAAYAAAGMTATVVDDDPEGLLMVAVTVLVGEAAIGLRVRYPSGFPWFPPSVSDPDRTLGDVARHVNRERGLCLVHAEDWHLDTTAAELITAQLPLLLAHQVSPPERPREAPVPEPASVQGAFLDRSAILLDTAITLPEDATAGYLTWQGSVTSRLFGAVTATHDRDGTTSWTTPVRSPRLFGDQARTGRWVRHDEDLPRDWTARDLWDRIQDLLPPKRAFVPGVGTVDGDTAASGFGDGGDTDSPLELVLVRVRDETAPRVRGPAWVALLYANAPASDDEPDAADDDADASSSGATVDGGREVVMVAVRVDPAGLADLAARHPHARRLTDRRVLLVGLGALGSHLAVLLAGDGVGALTLVDGEEVAAVNITRQRHSLPFIGIPKAHATASVVLHHNPYARVTSRVDLLGGTDPEGHDRITGYIREADLVIDATAAPAATRYLAHHARSAGVGLLHVSGTPGVLGATIVHIDPDPAAGCWACLEHHRADPGWPTPPTDPAGTLHPPGCSTPSFTGHAADVALLAATAARTAVRLLARDGGEVGSRAAICDLRAGPMLVAGPGWQERSLAAHPSCPLHDTVHVPRLIP